jgi:hypothetical protein
LLHKEISITVIEQNLISFNILQTFKKNSVFLSANFVPEEIISRTPLQRDKYGMMIWTFLWSCFAEIAFLPDRGVSQKDQYWIMARVDYT